MLGDDTWDAVEADFQREYGLDLWHEVNTVGLRRILALVKGLPPESALWAAIRLTTPQGVSLDELSDMAAKAKQAG